MDYPPSDIDPSDPRLIKRDRSAELSSMMADLVRHFDAKPSFRAYNCRDCGKPIKALLYQDGRREILDATTYEPHLCPRPVKPLPPKETPPPPPAVRSEPPKRPPDKPKPKRDDMVLM